MGSAADVAALVDTSSLVRAGALPALLVLLLTTGGGVVPLVVEVTPPEVDTVSGEATMIFGAVGVGDTDSLARCFSSSMSVFVVAVVSESRIFGVSSLHLPDAAAVTLTAGSELFASDWGLALRREEFSGELSGWMGLSAAAFGVAGFFSSATGGGELLWPSSLIAKCSLLSVCDAPLDSAPFTSWFVGWPLLALDGAWLLEFEFDPVKSKVVGSWVTGVAALSIIADCWAAAATAAAI